MSPVLQVVVRIIAYVHLVSGASCFFDPTVTKVSSIAGLGWLVPLQTVGPSMVGLILVSVGASAFLAGRWSSSWSLVLVVPQQVVLIFQLVSIGEAILLGRYPDGYVPSSSWFILADQSPTLFLSWGHVVAFFQARRAVWKL